MKIKLGNDIIKTERIKELYQKHGETFLNKIFTKTEIEYCESRGVGKYNSYAARFAAKEAIYKAVSDLLDDRKIGWKDIEIINEKNGKPKASVKAMDLENEISLSHEKDYAIATALVYTD